MLVFGLVAAAVLGLGQLSADLPSERSVVVRVRSGERIDRVELAWQEDDKIVHRTLLAAPFQGGTSTVRLSDGQHGLKVSIYRGAEVSRQQRVVQVVDGARQIVIEIP